MIEITQPFLFFGGPYSNLEALQEMRKVAQRLNIEADQCLCSGDVVAYCADPQGCVDEIRDWGVHVVMGNCEESLGFGKNDCGCGFDEGTACDLLSKQWFDYAERNLNEDARKWMRELPRSIDLVYKTLRLQAIHGGIDEINRFIFASQNDVIAEEFKNTSADIILGGHCGIPFVHRQDEKLWVNSGVIGMPANDARSNTYYVLITPHEDGLEFSFHELVYDYGLSAEKMRRNNLAEVYAKTLETGVWSSLDVLPDTEKEKTASPLNLETVFYKKAS